MDDYNIKRENIARAITDAINDLGLKVSDIETGVLPAGIAHAMTNAIVATVPPPDWERILEVWVKHMRKEITAQKTALGGTAGHA